MGLKIDGVFSSACVDTSSEVIDIEGMDISSLKSGQGVLNFEHKNPKNPGASFLDVLGAVTFAKKIFSEKDCDDERQLYYWKQIELPFGYLRAELFDSEGHPGAIAAAAIIRYYADRDLPILVRLSVDGSTIERDGNVLKRTIARDVALTLKPCNQTCYTGVLDEKPKAKSSGELDELTRSEDGLTRFPGVEFTMLPFDTKNQTPDPLNLIRHELQNLQQLNKAMSISGGGAAPGGLTQGPALAKEDVQSTNTFKRRLTTAYRDWNRRASSLKDHLVKSLPDVHPDFLQKFVDVIAETQMKKAAELHDYLQKALDGDQKPFGQKMDDSGSKPGGTKPLPKETVAARVGAKKPLPTPQPGADQQIEAIRSTIRSNIPAAADVQAGVVQQQDPRIAQFPGLAQPPHVPGLRVGVHPNEARAKDIEAIRSTIRSNIPGAADVQAGIVRQQDPRVQTLGKAEAGIFWHGTPSGDLRGGFSGLHIGSQQAATEALTARIGHPAEGTWDGTREYGKTLLAGQKTLRARGIYPTGYNSLAPEEDHYAVRGPRWPRFSGGDEVLSTHRPDIFPLRIVGPMSNLPQSPHGDFAANGRMKSLLARGQARRGFYYRNVGEDAGSISAVLPGGSHIERVEGLGKAEAPHPDTLKQMPAGPLKVGKHNVIPGSLRYRDDLQHPLAGQDLKVIGHGPHHYEVLSGSGPSAARLRVPKELEGKAYEVLSHPQEVDVAKPLGVDQLSHGSRHPDQLALANRVDFSHRKNPIAGDLDSTHLQWGIPPWSQGKGDQKVFIKPSNTYITGHEANNPDESLAEVAFHNAARDVFGLGQTVPTAVAFWHPKDGRLHSAHDFVHGADTPGEDSLESWHQQGLTPKMATMDYILGHVDRHLGNVMSDAQGLPKLIDNGDAFHYNWVMTPRYINEAHKQDGFDPATAQWVQQLQPQALKQSLEHSGMPPVAVEGALRRLALLHQSAAAGQPLGYQSLRAV